MDGISRLVAAAGSALRGPGGGEVPIGDPDPDEGGWEDGDMDDDGDDDGDEEDALDAVPGAADPESDTILGLRRTTPSTLTVALPQVTHFPGSRDIGF